MADLEKKTEVGEPSQEPRESSWLKGLFAGGWIYVLLLVVVFIVLPTGQTQEDLYRDWCVQGDGLMRVFFFNLRNALRYPGAWIMDQVFDLLWPLLGWRHVPFWSTVEEYASLMLTFALSAGLGAAITGGRRRIRKIAFILAMVIVLGWQIWPVSMAYGMCHLLP